MSLGAQLRRLNAQAATFRQDAFGTQTDGTLCQLEYDRGEKSCDCYYSPIKDQIRTNEVGFTKVIGATVRFAKSVPFTPARRKPITIRETVGTETVDHRFIIIDILGTHPTSAEWVLKCDALNA
jgi:hypothetical protein